MVEKDVQKMAHHLSGEFSLWAFEPPKYVSACFCREFWGGRPVFCLGTMSHLRNSFRVLEIDPKAHIILFPPHESFVGQCTSIITRETPVQMDRSILSHILNLKKKLKVNQVIAPKVDRGESIVLIHRSDYVAKLLQFLTEYGARESPSSQGLPMD